MTTGCAEGGERRGATSGPGTGRAGGRPGGGARVPARVGGRVPARFPGDAQGRAHVGARRPEACPPRAGAGRRGMEAGAADALLSGLCVVFTLGMFSTGL